MIQIIIKFNDAEDTELRIENPAYIPNIGESVSNRKEAMSFFYVISKDIYFNPDINLTNVYIRADKK